MMHHADFLLQLVAEGKIRPSAQVDAKITFHDSCYLARYNQIETSPRSLLEAIPGTQLIEMGRHGDRGFCCGAGGGRMFMEEHEGTRINEERTREAIVTGAGVIGTACPFCMTMLTDGVKTMGRSDDIIVEDLAEVLWRSVSGETI